MKLRMRMTAVFAALAILFTGCSSNEQQASHEEITGSSETESAAGGTQQGTTAEQTTASAGGSSENTEPNESEPVESAPIESAPEIGGTPESSSTSGTTAGTTSGTTGGTTSGTTAQTTRPKPASDSDLTESGSGYEGSKTTGSYNYGEALQKAILFYELQRSGDIDESNTRCNWRGDSGMNDGADVGLDLTGGLYDAGDNVKFNLPMAYTSAMLAWSVYLDRDSYKKSGQLEYITDTIRWVNDYLMKCHPQDDVYYYQVGDGNADHAWWGAAEVMQMNRPSYKVDKNNPGSAVSAEAAASLAACAVIFKDTDSAYSKKCLEHAKQLYDFAERTKSDAGYTAANGFYNSWSGFYDELTWAGAWLWLATGDNSYLTKAETYLKQCGGNYKWTMCWDDVYTGAVTLLACETGKQDYKDRVEKTLDWWTTGTGGERITYSPKGLAYLDSWGSLRYATTAAFIAAVYADSGKCPSSKQKTYMDFCASQVNYALGSTGRSFVVGFGENPPQHPHHRTSQGSWSDNMNEPGTARHTLYGALVGGPDASDGYSDTVSDYCKNEVADDYNAGFVGALAKMYKQYGGQTLKNFGAIEEVGDELYVEQRVNATGNGFTEIKAMIYNKTGWPARVTDNLELRYFIDLSEVIEAGGSASDITVSLNYAEGAKFGGIYEWNKAKNIYYVSIDFSGAKIYPGGQSAWKKEVQFRMLSANGTWNADNDPSFKELVGTNGSELVRASHAALYEGGKLVFGTEPDGKSAGLVTPPQTTSNSTTKIADNTTAGGSNNTPVQDNGISVSLNQQAVSGRGNTIQFTLDITNNTGKAIDLSSLAVEYYFTADGNNDLNFWCDYSATSGDNYTALTDSVKGTFSKASGKNTDTLCKITYSSGTLSAGGTLTLQVRITRADWTEFDLGNDFSAGNVHNIRILKGGSPIFGSKP